MDDDRWAAAPDRRQLQRQSDTDIHRVARWFTVRNMLTLAALAGVMYAFAGTVLSELGFTRSRSLAAVAAKTDSAMAVAESAVEQGVRNERAIERGNDRLDELVYLFCRTERRRDPDNVPRFCVSVEREVRARGGGSPR